MAFGRRWWKARTEIAPLTAFHDLDSPGLLTNVPTLNFHPHLPHYELTGSESVHVLARQPIDPNGRILSPRRANGVQCLLWMPPTRQRAGDIVLVDSTNFTTLFGGTDSLETCGRTLPP